MLKGSVIKRRSSHGKVARPNTATLRRRKSGALQPSSGRNQKDNHEASSENHQPLVLKQESLNVSAGRKIYERASSRRERHRLALKNQIELGKKDGSNHFVALGRGGARGPNRSSLTKEVPEGEDLGLQAIAANKHAKRFGVSKKQSILRKPASPAAGKRSRHNQNIFTTKMKATRQQSKKVPLREKLMKR